MALGLPLKHDCTKYGFMTNDIIELEARASSALSMNFCMPSRRMAHGAWSESRITLFSGKSMYVVMQLRYGYDIRESLNSTC